VERLRWFRRDPAGYISRILGAFGYVITIATSITINTYQYNIIQPLSEPASASSPPLSSSPSFTKTIPFS
jgi:hypothetical protein